MPKEIWVTVNGRVYKALLVDKVKKIQRTKKHGDKVYHWEEVHLDIYLPKHLRAQRYLVVPLD